MLKRKLFLCFTGPKSDLELCSVGTQTFQRHDLGQPGFHAPPAFVVAGLGLVTDLQRPLERRRA